MNALVKSFKGKVVYLDIWGTWCGPCKDELTYVPELKAHFKGKDVVYIYLDMDEDDKDATWREFIKVNNMEGLHLRKNRKTIEPVSYTHLDVYKRQALIQSSAFLTVLRLGMPYTIIEF